MADVVPLTAAGTGTGAASPQCRRLARVLLQTQEMLELARAGDWETVAQRERARREELRQCFEEPPPAAHGELVAEALAALLHLNEELMACLAEARETVLRQGARQARTRSAIAEYRGVPRGP